MRCVLGGPAMPTEELEKAASQPRQKYVTLPELAALLRVSTRRVRDLRRRGMLPPGRVWQREVVLDWLPALEAA